MQTTLQFGSGSTIQEWSSFKGMLSGSKSRNHSLLQSNPSADLLISHLSQQLQGAGVIKV